MGQPAQMYLEKTNLTDRHLQDTWKKWEADECVSPFLHYDYVANVCWSIRWTEVQYAAEIYCVKGDDGNILMIAPLKRNLFKGIYKMLADLQGVGMADVLFRPGLDWEIKCKCVEVLLDKVGKKALLRRLDENGDFARILAAYTSGVKEREKTVCVSIDLNIDIDSYFAGLSSSVRQNVRTAYNRMKRDGRVYELKVYDGDVEMPKKCRKEIMSVYLSRLFSKYKHRGGMRLFDHLKYKYLKHDSKSLFVLDNRFHAVLYIDGRIAGFMNGLKSHDNASIVVPRLAIDNTYRFYSPGYVLVYETIKYLAAEGQARVLDLSRGDEKYKLDLGGKCYYTRNFLITRP